MQSSLNKRNENSLSVFTFLYRHSFANLIVPQVVMLDLQNSFTTFVSTRKISNFNFLIWTKIKMVRSLLSNEYFFFTNWTFYFVGKVDLEELISAFKDLGIEMDKTEARRLLLRYMSSIDIWFWSVGVSVYMYFLCSQNGSGW